MQANNNLSQYTLNVNVNAQNANHGPFHHSPELEQENKQLKSDLKKSQEAISLLIGAVRSNHRLDKFRVEAEKILHGEERDHYEAKQFQKDQVKGKKNTLEITEREREKEWRERERVREK